MGGSNGEFFYNERKPDRAMSRGDRKPTDCELLFRIRSNDSIWGINITNFMPVAKVRPRMQMLFKIIGRKALIGGFVALNNINLMLP